MSYQFKTQFRGQSFWTSGAGFGGSTDPIVFGTDLPDPSFSFVAQPNENWQHVLVSLAVVAGTALVFDLNNPTNTLLDRINRPVQISTLRFAMLLLATPTPGQALTWGPDGVTGAAQLWFSSIAVGICETVDYEVIRPSMSGWPLVAGVSSKIQVANPTNGTISAFMLLSGNQ